MVGFVAPLRPSEAYRVTQTLTQTPVTGQLAHGETFEGELTIHAFALDDQGQLVATGSLGGMVVSAPGVAMTIPSRPFTTLAALLDLRGDCLTVVDLAPLGLTPLQQEVTLVPVILSLRDAPPEEHLLHSTLCTLAHAQE
jgi:hypothetical protein